jgi:hypothetical protein
VDIDWSVCCLTMAPTSPASRKRRASSAPPTGKRKSSSSSSASGGAKKATTGTTDVSTNGSVTKRSRRPPTAKEIEKEAALRRRNASIQSGIEFDTRDKFAIGMKLLLPNTIYPTPSSVRSLLLSMVSSNIFL